MRRSLVEVGVSGRAVGLVTRVLIRVGQVDDQFQVDRVVVGGGELVGNEQVAGLIRGVARA